MATEVEEYDLVACTICIQAKQHSKIIWQPVSRTACPFKIIHSHLGGPITPTSCSGLPYFIIYIDNHTRYTSGYFLRTKEATDITGSFQKFITRIEKWYAEYSVMRFQCPNGRGEYSNTFFHRTPKASGVLFKPAPPYATDKNGLSEQIIRIIATKGQRLWLDLKIGPELWAEPINTPTYLQACSSSQVLENRSPYAVLCGDKPSLLYICHFSYLAFKLVPEAQRRERKFGSKSKKYAMPGYVHNTSQIWKLWDIKPKKPFHFSDIIFDQPSVANSFEYSTGNDILKHLLPQDILLVDANVEDPVNYHDINMRHTESPIEQFHTVSILDKSARLPGHLIENMGCTESSIFARPVVYHKKQHTPVAESVQMQPTPAVCLDSRPAQMPPQASWAVPPLWGFGGIKLQVSQVAYTDRARSTSNNYKGSRGEDPASYANAAGDKH